MQLKKISVLVTITLIITIAAVLSGCTNNTASPTPTAAPAGGDLKAGLPATLDFNIQVFDGEKPVTLSFADIKNMEFKELKNVTTVNSVGTPTGGDYVGVSLMEIAKLAGLPTGDVSFICTASDTYNMSYTREQFDAGIVAFKTNGTALNANVNSEDCVRIIIPGELKNMWLKMPVKFYIVGSVAKPVALSISGANVTTKKTYSLDELKNMTAQTKTITTIDSKNNTVTATGVSLNYLLDQVGPTGTTVQFISGDASGFSKNVSIKDIHASPDAIVAIDENGVLRDIIPGQPSNTWVGNLLKIRID
ncbi:MAG TPA: molybdopterin-dependent oxidoreductase [Methanocella sp.]|jgi:hypothetical protein